MLAQDGSPEEVSMDDLHAHVVAEPIEAPVEVAPRGRNLVKERALLLGHTAMSQGRSPYSVEDFARGIEIYEHYRLEHDRRAR